MLKRWTINLEATNFYMVRTYMEQYDDFKLGLENKMEYIITNYGAKVEEKNNAEKIQERLMQLQKLEGQLSFQKEFIKSEQSNCYQE